MKPNIALIGFMGTGKSAAGELVALKLGRRFIETDTLIEERAGQTITWIFRHKGEAYFRRLEHEVIRDVAGQRNMVIACGGGVVLNATNVELLRQSSLVIYLTAAISVILRRLATGSNKRPLLDVPDRTAKIKLMLQERRPLYERATDLSINTTHLSKESLADKIIRELSRYES